MSDPNTVNKFMVAVQGDGVRIMLPPAGLIPKEDAMLLAAWLVALSFCDREDFMRVLDAVENT